MSWVLHHRPATSTPSSSLSHPPRTRRRVVDHRGHSPVDQRNRGRRAKNAGVATGRAAAAACRWRKNASSITATPGLAAMAASRAGKTDRVARKTNLPHRYAAAATRRVCTASGSAGGFVSVARDLATRGRDRARQTSEFLPTGPHQTARGDAPDTTERHEASAAAPGPRSSRAPSLVSTRPRPA